MHLEVWQCFPRDCSLFLRLYNSFFYPDPTAPEWPHNLPSEAELLAALSACERRRANRGLTIPNYIQDWGAVRAVSCVMIPSIVYTDN